MKPVYAITSNTEISYGFLFRSEFIFRTTQELEFFFIFSMVDFTTAIIFQYVYSIPQKAKMFRHSLFLCCLL